MKQVGDKKLEKVSGTVMNLQIWTGIPVQFLTCWGHDEQEAGSDVVSFLQQLKPNILFEIFGFKFCFEEMKVVEVVSEKISKFQCCRGFQEVKYMNLGGFRELQLNNNSTQALA